MVALESERCKVVDATIEATLKLIVDDSIFIPEFAGWVPVIKNVLWENESLSLLCNGNFSIMSIDGETQHVYLSYWPNQAIGTILTKRCLNDYNFNKIR